MFISPNIALHSIITGPQAYVSGAGLKNLLIYPFSLLQGIMFPMAGTFFQGMEIKPGRKGWIPQLEGQLDLVAWGPWGPEQYQLLWLEGLDPRIFPALR